MISTLAKSTKFTRLDRLGRAPLLGMVRVYRAALSPMLGPACRFEPTCSVYAEQAIARYGACRGSYLALRRLLRCHPFSRGGLDPVPPLHPSSPPDGST
jgi:putative membrane protein insertion efficiency factor